MVDKSAIDELVRSRLVHEIHTSERKSFRGCRRRWSWIFKDYYYPKVTAKPLEFGVAFHEAMETLYDPKTWKFDRQIVLNSAIQVFIDKCNEQRKKFLEFKEAYQLDNAEAEEDYDERVELGKGMLKYFGEKVQPEWDQYWVPRKVEIEFLVPIQNPDTGEYLICDCAQCEKLWTAWVDENPPHHTDEMGNPFNEDGSIRRFHGLPVVLAGRIDAIMQDSKGNLWIVDWKTAAQISRERGDEFLYLDDQISSYVMALRRKLGIDIKGFLYVEIRKAVPEAPQRNKSIRLGRAFSVSKSQATELELYEKTVREEDKAAYEAGLYDEFLTYLREEGMVYHHRYQILKSDEELEQIERMLFEEASDMIDPKIRIYPNAGKFNCGYCAFRQPCLETNRQGDPFFLLDELFDKRTRHYWVKELSTDKQGGE
jgi:hypothetical protein